MAEPDVPSPKPFVVGVNRSGTTLLRLMLDSHPQLTIPPETHFVPELIDALKEMGRADIKVVAGGVIPAQDYAMLRAAGVQAIFGPGTNLADAADEVLRLLGHNKPPMDVPA